MCEFKSAIVLKDESVKGGFRLLISPWTESHSELCQLFKLNDGANARMYFARVEFKPSSLGKAHLVDQYALHLDEERTPEWWDDEIESAVTEKMRKYIGSIIVTGDVPLLVGGQFVVGPGAKVGTAHSMVINSMTEGGTISKVSGGTISKVSGGTINEVSGGTISKVSGGVIAQIVPTYRSLLVGPVSGSGQILSDGRGAK